ncbi:MAG: hypothetical protein KDK65_05260 [Chlamydiia bacterium]|nr:hypothetical protein [Chlamydiia bacterium]
MNLVFLIAHPGPAEHFAAYSQVLTHATFLADPNVQAKCPAAKVYQSIDQIPQEATVVIDIAEKWLEVVQQLQETHPKVRCFVYYDNPEPFVPAPYSETASKLISLAQGVLFANAALKGIQDGQRQPIDLTQKGVQHIGYYPKEIGDKLLADRQNAALVAQKKREFFKHHNLTCSIDTPVFVYMGGANKEYYLAFDHFLKLIKELPPQPLVFIHQRHPRDTKPYPTIQLPQGCHFVTSHLKTPETLLFAKGALYYQTSMAPQCVFAGLPQIVQVGHEPYSDAVIRCGAPSVTTVEVLKQAMTQKTSVDQKQLEQELGYDPNWKSNLQIK